jgi:hypothetical protein
MLKKNTNTLNNSRSSTRRTSSTTTATSNATVLKPIYPAAPAINQHKRITPNDSIKPANLTSTGPFLLPTSDLFVVDKDSLVLSESDIFQTNLARGKALSIADKHHQQSVDSSSSPVSIRKQQQHTKATNSGKGVQVFRDNVREDYDFDHDEKENVPSTSVYAGLLSSNGMKRPLPPSSVILPLKAPVITHNHVLPTSQSDKDKQQIDKGLRHFSAKVCAKVEEKGVTSYNEVADDLVQEIGLEMGKFDHKNIRRRVYDALNVLMAIDIIRKEKKEIRWLGLPNETADDMRELEQERAALQERITEKTKNLKEVLRRCISLKNLIDRNSELQTTHQGDKLSLPFILISAAKDCHVHCEMLEDRTQYFFEFNTAFQINEDIELMRLMGLDTARIEKIKTFFPKELVAQVLMLCLNNSSSSTSSSSVAAVDMISSASISSLPIAVNNSVFAPIINNEDLNLGDLESFASSSLSSSL